MLRCVTCMRINGISVVSFEADQKHIFYVGFFPHFYFLSLSISAPEEVDQLSRELRGRSPPRPRQGLWGPLSAKGPQGRASV